MKKDLYKLPYDIVFKDPVTGKTKTIPKGYPSDGASGPAIDIWSEAWWIHDPLCPTDGIIPPVAVGYWERNGYWDDGTACTPQDSTRVLGDVLRREGRWIRARLWPAVVGPYQLWKQRNRDMSPIEPLEVK